jgi:hypothetical protein
LPPSKFGLKIIGNLYTGICDKNLMMNIYVKNIIISNICVIMGYRGDIIGMRVMELIVETRVFIGVLGQTFFIFVNISQILKQMSKSTEDLVVFALKKRVPKSGECGTMHQGKSIL